MKHNPLALSNADLIAEVKNAASDERRATAALIALLAELEERQLFFGEGCGSLFVYCTRVLRLSEHAAYGRIAAARASRRFPVILELLECGAITLTTVKLLASHLEPENCEHLLDAARHKTKEEVQELIACLHPQPDIKSSIRKAPVTAPIVSGQPTAAPATSGASAVSSAAAPPSSTPSVPRATVAPLAPERYLIKVTVSLEAHDNLKRAQDLLRHVIPNGDPAAIIERALATLVDQLERTRTARVEKPRAARDAAKNSRHVPSSVRRAIWARDGGRCAFVGTEGRCTETGFLEVHHLEPYAHGGPATIENLSLRCRAHNAYEAVAHFGERSRGAPLVQRELGLDRA